MSGTGRHYLLGNAVPTIFQSYEKSVGSNHPHRIPFQELNSNVAPGKNIDSIETIDDRSGLNWNNETENSQTRPTHVFENQVIQSKTNSNHESWAVADAVGSLLLNNRC
ncbi:hypothetical protein OUZ56_032899 [Daphnia magna]|uniref:Uncharacterized protein n=1 Tax=Daphnia magna TaxID=35525 RepID=A0ABR0B9V6_9CRUS|nr:hypothetical protein OUZ56_032899 [Daphnia magna]